MATEEQIERALAAATASLNDHNRDTLDTGHLQTVVEGALDGAQQLTVDDGGGVHDGSGARVGAIRRTDSGEWIAERQNQTAVRAETPVPSRRPRGTLRRLLHRLGV